MTQISSGGDIRGNRKEGMYDWYSRSALGIRTP